MTPLQPEPVVYLKPGELASRLGVSRETIRRMARSGRIPCLRVGKSVRFSLSDVLARLEQSA